MSADEAARTEPRPRLLLVEDEPALRVLLARVLDRAGYEVADAPSGEEGLDRFNEARESFGAAVVDLTLPGMSGEAVVERLRAARPGMAIIVTSGLAGGPRGGVADGRMSFLQKPFLPARLVEALRAARDGGPERGAPAQGVPAEGSQAGGAPDKGVPGGGAAASDAPAEGAPGGGAAASDAPAEGAPGDGAPAQSSSSSSAS